MKRTTIEPVKKKKLVLIGNGPAGFKFCEKFVKYRLGKHYDLTVYGGEQYPAYDRINLTRYFKVLSPDQLYLAPASWYAQNKITLNTGQQVVSVNRATRLLQTESGVTATYDTLIFATGSAPFVPPIANSNRPGVFLYRTLDDLSAIRAYLQPGQKAVVIGGGLLGLEAARALVEEGLDCSILESAPYLMPRQLDVEGSAVLQQQLEDMGLHVHCNRQAGSITRDGLLCADGTFLPAGLVVISAGIRPRDELASACGLQTGEPGGIVVNNYNLTSDEHIYAIGECALANGKIWGLAAPCFEMAEVVAARLAKVYKVFSGQLPLTRLKVLEVKVASFGDALGQQPHIAHVYKQQGLYKRVNVTPDGEYVLGGMLIGEAGDGSALFHMQRNRVRIIGDPAALALIQSGTSSKISDLPDDTVICLCESICKGDIVKTIYENNCKRLDEVRLQTGAGSGCGSCAALIEELLANMVQQPESTKNDCT